MKKKKFLTLFLLAFCFAAVAFTGRDTAYSASKSLTIVEIDYEKETLTVKSSADDNMLFTANSANASKWEMISDQPDVQGAFVIDISWAAKTKDLTFYLKGDVSTTPLRITLPKQNTNFKPVLNFLTGNLTFSNIGTHTRVYWRKSTSTIWNVLETNAGALADFQYELERFYQQGITLYFRTGQVAGDGSSAGSRPSKEAALKIAKRGAAPSVKVDYSAFTIDAKNTMEYKTSEGSAWEPVANNQIKLEEAMEEVFLSSGPMGADVDADFEVSIDIRTKAAASKPASKAVTLTVKKQRNISDENITIEYSSAQLALIVGAVRNPDGTMKLEAASASNPYEFTIVKDGDALDTAKAAWTAVASGDGVNIKKEDAPEGSKIYVRKKAAADALASRYVVRDVGKYPDAAMLEGGQAYNFTKIEGVSKTLSFNLVFDSSRNLDRFQINSIVFETADGKYFAEAGFKQGSVRDNGSTQSITVTLHDFAKIESNSNLIGKQLYSKIAIEGEEDLNSIIRLTITKAAKIEHLDEENDVDEKDITLYNEIRYPHGKDEVFRVVLGSDSGTSLAAVRLADVLLAADTDYTQTAGTLDGEKIITIKIHKAYIEKFATKIASSKIGKTNRLAVELSNGEKLTSKAGFVVENVIQITSATTSIVMSNSRYGEYLAKLEEYNHKVAQIEMANGSSSALIKPEAPYQNPEFTFSFGSFDYEAQGILSLVGVNWLEGSGNILLSCEGSGGAYAVELSIAGIMKANGSDEVQLVFRTKGGEDILLDAPFTITVVD